MCLDGDCENFHTAVWSIHVLSCRTFVLHCIFPNVDTVHTDKGKERAEPHTSGDPLRAHAPERARAQADAIVLQYRAIVVLH